MKLASNYVRVAGLAALGIGSRTALAFTEAQRPLGGSTPGNPLDANFQKYVTDLLERWHVPGLAIAIIDGDSTWAEGYGLADVASKIPVTPRTLFFGCSTTKAFAGATVASLIDSGKYRNPSFPQRPVTWATPVSEILPEDFVLQDEWATAHLTLEDALTHRSGLPNHDNAYGGINATLRDHIRSLRHLPLNAPPRVRYQYCNLMFMAASHAVESLTGRDLGSVMQDWIWKPLGMDNTFFELKNAQAAGGQVATGYYWNPKEAAYKAMPYMPLEQTSGAGAIISNVLDYAKWVRALIREDPPLSKAVHEVIKAPRVFESSNPGLYDSPGGYALGWITTSYKGRRLWGHQGSADAWGAEVTFIPSLGFGVVGFANSGIFSNGVIKAVTFKLIEDKLGLANEDREDWEGWYDRI
ncbi:beta-lactamase/transpeptidase-like protein [Thozetella sp. PMI_491]|nr:beta-lactamase/transpeptidase-like protein [Thozetella sp. PMI_491]